MGVTSLGMQSLLGFQSRVWVEQEASRSLNGTDSKAGHSYSWCYLTDITKGLPGKPYPMVVDNLEKDKVEL